MSKFEWMELETLSNEITHAQSRLDAARATKNLGLVQLLEREITDAATRRAQILADITKGLGLGHSARPKPQLVVAHEPQELAANPQQAEQSPSQQSIEQAQAQQSVEQTQSQSPSEQALAAAAAASNEPNPSTDTREEGVASMWDKLTPADLERAKRGLATRRSEILARHAEELKALETEQAEIDGIENAIAAFTQKFKLTKTAEVVPLDVERVPAQAG